MTADQPGTAERDTAEAIHRRITHRLSALLPDTADTPPHPYLRRYLVDHATRGATLTDNNIPATLLPWETSGHVRAGLGLPITTTPDNTTLAAWAAVEPFLGDATPASRALSLDFARTATGHPTGHVHPPGLRPRWAHWSLPNNVLCHTPSPVRAIAVISAPGQSTLLVTGGDDGTVRLWDPVTATPVGNPLTGHTDVVGAVAAVPLPDGRTLLATTSDEHTVRLWDPITATPIGNPLTGHTGPIAAVAAVPLPDGRTLLATTTSSDHTVRLWDPLTGRQLATIATAQPVLALCAHIDHTSRPPSAFLAITGTNGIAVIDCVSLTDTQGE